MFEHCLYFLNDGTRSYSLSGHVKEQEAQVSQRNRATLRVIEDFAKSLKITQGHSK